jgi:eukaryotic-like serine/threonine-protein kinase
MRPPSPRVGAGPGAAAVPRQQAVIAVLWLPVEGLSPRRRRRTTKARSLQGIPEALKYDWRSASVRACKFSVRGAFSRQTGRERPYGRRTQEPVESPHTLVQPLPARVPSAAQEGARRPIVPAGNAGGHDEHLHSEGLVLGRYRLLERLGRGGFGEVWRAHDELLHREVAVKRIWLGPEGDSERAAREALAAARLAHPAIVALYEANAVEDAFYLISELVDGQTLAQLIAAGTLEDEELLEIGAALADALCHAHARGVIHRDIKPQNVLVPARPQGPAGAAKLTDFGGASLAGEDALTRTGDVLGTLAYMAPEQSEGREVGEEADLYALALVLYEALSGVNPVRGPTPAATARRIGRRLEPLERRRRDLPRTLTRSLDTALEPSPDDRGTLAELRAALEEALEGGLGRSWRRPALRVPRAESLAAQEHPAAQEDPLAHQDRPARRRRALPRRLWIAAALATIVWQAWEGRPGVGLLIFAAVLPLLALPADRASAAATPAWPACAIAPLLGLAGLAGAFPALAGQARRWRERALLGAIAYWWLMLCGPLLGPQSLGGRLWLRAPAGAGGTPTKTAWEGSLGVSLSHVVGPMLSLGVLLGAVLWAAGAVTLPWLVRGRSALLDVVAVAGWSAALAASAPLLDSGLSAHAAHPAPQGAVLGAIIGAMVAVAARALRGPV